MNDKSLPWWLWIVLALLLLAQAMWIFKDARRRGQGKMAWLWGIWGLINVPTPLIVYWLVVVWPERRNKRHTKQ